VSVFEKRPAPRLAAVLAALVVLAATLVIGPASADTKEEIAQTEREIDALIDRINSQSTTIARLQRETNALTAEINAVLGRIANTEAKVAALERDIDTANAFLLELQGKVDDRAWDVYQNGIGTQIEVLLGASSFQDFAARLEFVNRAAESDEDLFNEIANRRNQLEHRQLELEAVKRQLVDERRLLTARQDALDAKLATAQRLLEQLEADKAEAQRLLEKLEDKRAAEIRAAELAAAAAAAAEAARAEAAAAEQEAAAAAAATAAAAVSPPEADGGGSEEEADDTGGGVGGGGGGGPFYTCPVDPPRAYSNDFGAPRPGGRTHQGNDIFAPYGTPIRATFPGNAVVTSNEVGGLAVNVYGSQGFTYNAHLSGFGQLGSVQTGDVIGYVGNSGNAQGTSPHNHFEWHPGGGAAVNPYYYLNEVC
jgi:peptidoglycan LD-endopeptidase LytH